MGMLIRLFLYVIPGLTRNPELKRCMQSYVYILASKKNGTLYIGVTDNLLKRIFEHKNNIVEGFTKKYHVHTLVYYEVAEEIMSAFEREKQLKKWKRRWKIALIEKHNLQWRDLYKDLLLT